MTVPREGLAMKWDNQGSSLVTSGWRRDSLRIAGVSLAYFIAHHLSFFFPDSAKSIMLIWPAGGIGLAAFLLNPRRLWPFLAGVLFVTGVLADVLVAHRPLLAGFGFMLANMAESIGCAWLILRVSDGSFLRFNRVREVLALIAGAVVINAVTSCFGAGIATLVNGAPFAESWQSWLIADGLGLLLVGPFVVAWLDRPRKLFRIWNVAEWCAFFLCWLLAVAVVFHLFGNQPIIGLHPYMLLGLLLWAALRLGVRGISLALVVLFVVAVLSPAIQQGPSPWAFRSVWDASHRLLDLQMFLGLLSCVGFLLAAEIADRVRAEGNARESRENYKQFFNLVPDMVCVAASDGFFKEINPAWAKVLGFTRGELLARPFLEFVHPDDRAATRAEVERLIANPSTVSFENRFLCKNGSYCWLEWDANPSDNGLFFAVAHDTTARKQAAENLARERSLLTATLESTADGILVVDHTGRVSDFNRVFREMWQIPEELVAARDDQRLIEYVVGKLSDPEAFLRQVQELYQTPEASSFDEIRFLDGRIFERYSQPQLLEGACVGRVWSFRDVTKRRQAEEALRQSEERYRVLFNASGDAMFAHGMTEDGQPRPFNMVNEVACQRYGYSQEELLRMTPLDLDAPEGRNMAPAAIQKLMGAKRVTWESQHQTKDGRYIPVEIAAVLIRYQGEVMVFSVARDITQRKQAEATLRENEEQLRQAVKLESIGRLAGGVAHDFNNLLMGIMGYIELCQGHPGVPDPIRHWLDEAMKGSRRSAEITRQLLAFASRQTIAPKVFDLNDRIAETLNLLRRLLGEEIDLSWSPAAGPAVVKMDPAQLDQILINLAANVREAIKGVGRLAIETRIESLKAVHCAGHDNAEPGEYVILTVSDTGHGMDAETLAHIYEPFFTTKEVGKGSGLGLATVYGIVRQNKGVVEVHSASGKGTTFRVCLPRCREEALEPAAAPGTRKTAEPRKRETILLVEDEEAVLATTRIFLEQAGYMVLSAEMPERALRLVANHVGRIHLLVTDVVMPGMSGRDLAVRLVQQHPEMKCIYMSGYSKEVIANHGVIDRDVNFLAKPFNRLELLHLVHEVLDRS